MVPSSIILILTPLFLPIAAQLGIPLGIIMTVNMDFGLSTPAVGLNLYVASHLSRLGLTEGPRGCYPSSA